MSKRQNRRTSAISWERACSIFGNAHPPANVWESQFDDCDDELKRLAATPYQEMDFSDLWYYHHDLAYVELQPELFAYLFPACLMDWHHSLMQNESCSHGDSEFHYGVHHGKVFKKMLSPKQRDSVFEFFRDSFLERLDNERGFVNAGSKTTAHGWMFRFNSLGITMDAIDMVWNPWWALDTPGRAIAALQYCSGLMYFEGENPLFDLWTPKFGGGGPSLWEHDSYIYGTGWNEKNLNFLTNTLTVDFVNDKVARAMARLREEPESEKARRVGRDLLERQDIIEERVNELPTLLRNPKAKCWTV